METNLRLIYQSKWGRRFLLMICASLLLALLLVLGDQKNFKLSHYMQLALDGIRGGSIYALIAIGFVVIHNVTGIINFAQGEFLMLGAMISASVFNIDGLVFASIDPTTRLIVAVIIALTLTTAIGALIERSTIFPSRRAPVSARIIITIGVTIVIRGAALISWGTRPNQLPAFTTMRFEDITLRIGELILKTQSFWIWATALITVAVLWYFFEHNINGKAMRACAINPNAAQLMGINPGHMSLLAFSLAAAFGALAGIVIAPVTRPTYDMGLMFGLKGFVAAVMGGLVSFPGAVLGGLILGMIENLGAGIISSGNKDIIAFGLLILVLLFRPQGFLTRKVPAIENA